MIAGPTTRHEAGPAVPVAVVAVVVVMVAALWWPALAGGMTVLHGDAILHGLPLVVAHAAWVAGRGSIAWAPWIYGGHPIFAEGQGAFAEPLNLLFAAVVTPSIGAVASMNLFHAACMVLAGIGMTGLCRALGFGLAATLVTTVATVFSPFWIGVQQNMTIGGAVTWIAFTLWAAERWLGDPRAGRSVVLGGAFALQVLAGYPQIAHGTALYLAASFLCGAPAGWRFAMAARARGLAIAVAVAIGLSAVQWVPLRELVGLSHRADGVGIVLRMAMLNDLRAMVFTQREIGAGFSGIGSLMVVVLIPFGAVLPASPRARGHLAGTVLLTVLGMGDASPLFTWIYDAHLIPGEHFFRVLVFYLLIAIPGGAILAGYAVDTVFSRFAGGARVRIGFCAVAVVLWGLAAWRLGPADHRVFQCALALLMLGLIAFRPARPSILRAAVALALLVECASLRLHLVPFFPRGLIAEPASVQAVLADPDHDRYRTYDATIYGAIGLMPARTPHYDRFFTGALGAFFGMTDRLWGLNSMNGALALSLARRDLLYPALEAEVAGRSPQSPGLRMIDLLALRDIAANGATVPADFTPLIGSAGVGYTEFVDAHAHPRFQLYARHVTATGPGDALALLGRATAPVLAIENPDGASLPVDAAPGPASFVVREARATRYRVEVDALRPVWLFLADADYPGWRAEIDGRPVALFAAQVLGKAVAVPAGRHEVTIRFRSNALDAGLAITCLTAAGLGLAAVVARTGVRSRMRSTRDGTRTSRFREACRPRRRAARR